MKPKSKVETVKVAVRVRPMNKREMEENSVQCVEVDNEQNQVSVNAPKHETKTFQFDYVYGMESTQREVYDQVAFPIVDSIFQGYNGTIFAYGQTGCGKTFTMMGVVSDPLLKGVVPNAFEHIFGYINSEGGSKTFLIRCSFVEIYNEEVRDWWGNPRKALDVREDPKKGTYVKDWSFTSWANTRDIEKCLDKGNNNRHVGVTQMNDQSSRSHSLFTVYVEIQEGEGKNKKIRSGKLNLVDWAGSERVGKTNATGQTFDEGKKINLSLTALGSVIDALAGNRKYIPYKDSKLTRWLSDSWGGNTKTVMFANCSPASYNYEETVGTWRYASRAKMIKNAPKINEDPKDALLRQYEEQIKLLKEQLEGKIGLYFGGKNEEDEADEAEKEKEKENEKESDNDSEDVNEKKVEKSRIKTDNMTPAEKQAWLAKIAELENEMISGGTKAITKDRGNHNNEHDEEDEKEKEKEQFKKYRWQQWKNVDEIEKKLSIWAEEKRNEEEKMQNDVNKLKKRIRYLNTEIEDLKYDNEKDRTDFLENIKGFNKDIKLYQGIISYLLTDNELRKVIDMSRYNDETETWRIHPFAIRNKSLVLPNVNRNQIPVFIDSEIGNREWVLTDQPGDERPNRWDCDRVELRNKAKENKKQVKLRVNDEVWRFNKNRQNNINININGNGNGNSSSCQGWNVKTRLNSIAKNSNNSNKVHTNIDNDCDNETNDNDNQSNWNCNDANELTVQNSALVKHIRAREKIVIDSNSKFHLNNININTNTNAINNNYNYINTNPINNPNFPLNTKCNSDDPESWNSSHNNSKMSNKFIPNVMNTNTTNITNINIGVINKKEREWYEELKKQGSINTGNNMSINSNEAASKQQKKHGKYVWDPIKGGSVSNNKLELSFKATLEISGNNGKSFEISSNNLNKKGKIKLDKITERNEGG